MPGKKFVQGDASGDGIVSTTDLNILSANWGATGGQKNLAKDFNRDGVVDGADFLIWQRGFGLPHCASRFEGDADGDGDVDSDDQPLNGSEQIVTSCGGAPMQMMVGDGESMAEQSLEIEIEARESDPADANEDGVIDYADVELWLDRAE